MEHHIVQFFFEVTNMPADHANRLMDLVLECWLIHFNTEQLIAMLSPFMSIVCRHVSEIALYTDRNENASRRDYQMGYLRIILRIIENE